MSTRELPDRNEDEARRWLANAEDDLRAMRSVVRDPDSPDRIACFLAHLVVEKAPKATLIDANLPFKKTHDVVLLYEMCRQCERLPELNASTLATLTPWSIAGRYADDLTEVDHELALTLTSFAEQVVTAVRSEFDAPDSVA